MKAIRHHQYCSPDDLKLEDIDKPTPKDNEVLVKVHASSVNPYDWHFVRGIPYLMRLAIGFSVPKIRTRGADFVGVVERVGSQVTQFKAGDGVYGFQDGAFAEYLCAPEDKSAFKPETMTFEEAASVPLAGVTALQGLLEAGTLKSGEHVLIIGASGGVGTFAVQIAKNAGARVTGVCSTNNVDFVTSLGADAVVDYTQEDFTKSATQYDLILQLGGEHTALQLRKTLTSKGRVILSSGDSDGKLLGPVGRFLILPFINPFFSQKLGNVDAVPNQTRLDQLREFIDQGRLKTVIDRTYRLDQVPQAIHYIETRHARAKAVIKIG